MNATPATDPRPQADPETATALKLWVVLSRAYHAVAEAARRDIERHGLGATEFSVLELLFHKGSLSLGEVGERVLLTSGSVTYVIDKLEKRRLLVRRACPEDRRVCYADLTQEGRALISAIFPEHAQVIREVTEGLSGEEQQEAIQLLKRLGRFAQDRA
jgi:MarR family 2-MHQ and catechol resistance regulon transcriptional repressor